ncbi:capsular biosynthesis protein [Clostridium sp. Bc-iso-3]|nr:capsular biosynthesis protein [Clostridium sp. Bc-iso-3]
MNKVFFVTYGGGHVRSIIPVIKELKSRNHEVSVLGLTSSVKDLKKQEIIFNGIKDYLNLFKDEDVQKILEYGDMFINESFDTDSGLDKLEIKLYLGMNLWDLSIQLGNFKEALKLFKQSGRSCFFPINSMEKILSYEKPDVTVVTCGKRAEKAAAFSANKMGINVVRIVDLLKENWRIPYKAKVCVLNDYAKASILSSNKDLDEQNVFVTGQPNIELNYTKELLDDFIEKYNLDKFDKVISFFSQPNIAYRDEVLVGFIELLQKRRNFMGIWKIHPNEQLDLYKKYIDILPSNLLILKEEDTNLILKESDLVITFFSTVGLQAIAADKPLITVNFSKTPHPVEYDKLGCALLVKNIAEFEDAINLLIENSNLHARFHEARKKLMPPRKAAENIANVIEYS